MGEFNISGRSWYPGGLYGKVKLIHLSWVRLLFWISNMQQSTQYLISELEQLLRFPTNICHRWCKLNFRPSHGSGELQDKTCKQQVWLTTLLTAAVSHEVKSSNYRCRNFNHQTYYNSAYWNHIWQSRLALLLC